MVLWHLSLPPLTKVRFCNKLVWCWVSKHFEEFSVPRQVQLTSSTALWSLAPESWRSAGTAAKIPRLWQIGSWGAGRKTPVIEIQFAKWFWKIMRKICKVMIHSRKPMKLAAWAWSFFMINIRKTSQNPRVETVQILVIAYQVLTWAEAAWNARENGLDARHAGLTRRLCT